MSGGGSKKQTVGYKYLLGMHMALCHGPADKCVRIRVDERNAWTGETSGGQIYINAPKLFGGEKREGGVQGYVDIEMGEITQDQNDYLVSKLGSLIPAFRGVVHAVLRQVYVGMNPYLKPWDFRMQRIHKRQAEGIAQWYDAKAEIFDAANVLQSEIADVATINLDQASYTYTTPEVATGYQLSGFNPGDILLMDWPAGLTYSAWSSWPNDTDNGGMTWRTRFLVKKADNSWEYHFNLGDAQQYFSTQAAAAAAAQANPAESISGSTSYRFSMIDVDPASNRGGLSLRIRKIPAHIAQRDMNPAHMVRECLTDPDWGMGYPEADIDDTVFMAAADALYAEKMGMSLLWDRSIPIEDFVKEVLKHIDATCYVNRTTGKFELYLVRANYDENTLLLLDESNVDRVENVKTSVIGDLVNSVTIKYWDFRTGKDATVSLDNTALAQIQGSIINTTVEYPGFTNSRIASRIAARDLKSLSTPLVSCTIYANREAAGLNVGHPFKLNWPDAQGRLNNVVMRVTDIAFGNGRDNRVRITATQDIYDLPESVNAAPPATDWTNPVVDAAPSPHRLVIEAPYYEIVQRKGDDEASSEIAAHPERGYLLVTGDRPAGDGAAINAQVWVEAGAGYAEGPVMDFAPYARLAADIGYTDETISIDSGVDLDLVEAGTHCQIGGELCKVVSVTDTALTAKRGVLDTVPATHVAGETILFWDAFAASDDVEYADAETVAAKILPVTGAGVLDIATATADSVTMDQRAARPYPPGQLKVNGSYYPAWIDGLSAFSAAWAHRDRLQQSGGDLIDYTYGNIGPESGTSYTLRIYGETDSLLRTESGLTGNGYTYSTVDETAESKSGSADPYWNQVQLLLNMNGANLSTVFSDTSPTPKTVTTQGGAVISTNTYRFGAASGYFPGSADGLVVYTFPAPGTSDLTIEGWLKPIAANCQPYARVVQMGSNNYSGGLWIIREGTTNPVRLYIQGYSGGAYINLVDVNALTLPDDRFTHFALVRKGDAWKLYINGIDTGTGSTNAYSISETILRLGQNNLSGEEYAGYMDDIRITYAARYNGNFTPPEQQLGQFIYDVVEEPYWTSVASLLNFNGTDASPAFTDAKGKTWTANGNAQIDTAQSKYGGAAGLFDGTGDYISTPDHADFDFGAGDFTIEAWIRVNAFASGAGIVAKGTSGVDGYTLSLTNVSPYQKIVLFMTSLGKVIEGTTSLASATWYHIALVRKGNVFTLYLNGVSEGSYTSSASLTASGDEVRAGVARDGTSFFNGHLDDLRITKGIARYVENFTPPASELTRYVGSGRLNGKIRFELESVRAGLASYQKHNVTVLREGYGFNYGYYYGGQ